MKDILPEGEKGKVEVHQAEEQYQLVLPCDVKDFKQFVSGLLGKPQEERGRVIGGFHVESTLALQKIDPLGLCRSLNSVQELQHLVFYRVIFCH